MAGVAVSLKRVGTGLHVPVSNSGVLGTAFLFSVELTSTGHFSAGKFLASMTERMKCHHGMCGGICNDIMKTDGDVATTRNGGGFFRNKLGSTSVSSTLTSTRTIPPSSLLLSSFSTRGFSAASSSQTSLSPSGAQQGGMYVRGGTGGGVVSASSNIKSIGLISEYEELIYGPDNNTIVTLFISRHSNTSLLLARDFNTLSSSGHSSACRFAVVDIDSCPRAAYHANIDEVPTIVVTKNDDAFRCKITSQGRNDNSAVMLKLKSILDTVAGKESTNRLAPKSTTAWYTHNIMMDNLNINRVGWPTS